MGQCIIAWLNPGGTPRFGTAPYWMKLKNSAETAYRSGLCHNVNSGEINV
jgi:hypothetical protein